VLEIIGSEFAFGTFGTPPSPVMVKLKTDHRNFHAEAALYAMVAKESGDKILHCYRHGQEMPYVVLENYGQDLRAYYQADLGVRTGPLLEEIMSAVFFLHHRLGFLHGNLQPANIRLSLDTMGKFTCKLCHFDNACEVGGVFPRLNGQLCISELWACPELLRAYYSKDLDELKGTLAMDIFNLGLIVEALCRSDLTPNLSVIPIDSAKRREVFESGNQQEFFKTIDSLFA
jgi:hypothetical protein